MKLPSLKGGASRQGSFIYIVPLDGARPDQTVAGLGSWDEFSLPPGALDIPYSKIKKKWQIEWKGYTLEQNFAVLPRLSFSPVMWVG